jgi:hypothetical protein
MLSAFIARRQWRAAALDDGWGARGERPRSPRTGVDECSSLHESTEDYGAKRSECDNHDGDL